MNQSERPAEPYIFHAMDARACLFFVKIGTTDVAPRLHAACARGSLPGQRARIFCKYEVAMEVIRNGVSSKKSCEMDPSNLHETVLT